MKKLSLTLVLFLSFVVVFAQTYQEIKVSKLPKGVTNYVAANFRGAKIVKAGQGSQNGITYYGAVLEDRGRKFSMIFDKDGNFLQKVENLSKVTLPGTTASTTKTPVNTLMPQGVKPLPLTSMPKTVQDYVRTTYPKGTLKSSGTYSKDGSAYLLVVLYDQNRDHYLTFTQKGVYVAKEYKTGAALPPASSTAPQPSGKPAKDNGSEAPVKK
jgi:hypothetical protein